jgi:hypothetical protein
LLAIEGAIVSIDAVGCQRDIAKKIIDKKADYVLALKGNQKLVARQCRALRRRAEGPWVSRIPRSAAGPSVAVVAMLEDMLSLNTSRCLLNLISLKCGTPLCLRFDLDRQIYLFLVWHGVLFYARNIRER